MEVDLGRRLGKTVSAVNDDFVRGSDPEVSKEHRWNIHFLPGRPW